MMRRLFVGVGEREYIPVVVGAANEADPGRQMIARETGGDDNRRHVD